MFMAAQIGAVKPLSTVNEESNLDQVYKQSVINYNNNLNDNPSVSVPKAVEYFIAGLYKLWFAVLYTPTINKFHTAWDRLKSFFH